MGQDIQKEHIHQYADLFIDNNFNYSKILDHAKSYGIKGLTNDLIAKLLYEEGVTWDVDTKRWIKISQTSFDSLPPRPNSNPSDGSKAGGDVPENNKKTGEKASSQSKQKSNKSESAISKKVDKISIKLNNVEETVEKLLSKISEIEKELSAKPEKVFSNPPSEWKIDMQKFAELSYSSGKRFELTLREELVNKAKEKLKVNFDLTALGAESKASRLFELILFDYINSK